MLFTSYYTNESLFLFPWYNNQEIDHKWCILYFDNTQHISLYN